MTIHQLCIEHGSLIFQAPHILIVLHKDVLEPLSLCPYPTQMVAFGKLYLRDG